MRRASYYWNRGLAADAPSAAAPAANNDGSRSAAGPLRVQRRFESVSSTVDPPSSAEAAPSNWAARSCNVAAVLRHLVAASALPTLRRTSGHSTLNAEERRDLRVAQRLARAMETPAFAALPPQLWLRPRARSCNGCAITKFSTCTASTSGSEARLSARRCRRCRSGCCRSGGGSRSSFLRRSCKCGVCTSSARGSLGATAPSRPLLLALGCCADAGSGRSGAGSLDGCGAWTCCCTTPCGSAVAAAPVPTTGTSTPSVGKASAPRSFHANPGKPPVIRYSSPPTGGDTPNCPARRRYFAMIVEHSSAAIWSSNSQRRRIASTSSVTRAPGDPKMCNGSVKAAALCRGMPRAKSARSSAARAAARGGRLEP
mmetsp:Transcript_110183/g.310737  ORF Transcript_110183/g.310737 Transcript_110183/m.310737 type:complete len:371 (-) Transcript_110183:908-2020(-)